MANIINSLITLFDVDARDHLTESDNVEEGNHTFSWVNCWPFAVLHAGCLGVLWVGFSWIALWVCLGWYILRMFAITGFYHRYFSHRTFKAPRWVQFLFAVIGNASVQKGPLWWAAHHRDHHRRSDQPNDLHSPAQRGFWYSHMGWITVEENLYTKYDNIPDFTKYPELVFINRFDWIVPVLMVGVLYALGAILQVLNPSLQTSGLQMIVWGGFISTTLLFHGTCTINSLSHQFGSQRYKTGDTSRNNGLLAFITLGEGWHNNHHHYPATARQGFYWWEFDITYYALTVMSWVGLVSDLKPIPDHIRDKHAVFNTNALNSSMTGASS